MCAWLSALREFFGAINGLAALIATGVVIYQANKFVSQQKESRIAEKRVLILDSFTDLHFELLRQIKNPGNSSSERVRNEKLVFEKLMNFKKILISWGSEKLMDDYIEWEEYIKPENKETISDALEQIDRFDRFYASVRFEIGFKDKKQRYTRVLLDSAGRAQYKAD